MKLAILDLGSNSFHLLVTRAVDGSLRRLDNAKEMVRLGAGTLVTGVIDEPTRERATEAFARLVARARAHEPDRLVVVATSAVREARNGRALAAELERLAGTRVQILDADEEARLVYRGAVAALEPIGDRMLVVDIGGGSVELAVGERRHLLLARSLPLGVLRLREQLVPADGYVSEATGEKIAAHVRRIATGTAREIRALLPRRLVCTSGTARTVVGLVEQLGTQSLSVPELDRVALARLRAILAKFRPASLTDLGVDEARTDTVTAGVIVMETLLDLLGFESTVVSPWALREGLAYRELDREDAAATAMSNAV